ncbi:hypothetical protein TNCV_1025571 [Trichonephila clavipes]|nr:hypothetical protein TNCV_1025571 [Trichonephila clavipes]
MRRKKIALNRISCTEIHVNNIPRDYQCPITTSLTSRERITLGSALRHELRNPHDPGNYSNDWLDQSAASYMLAGYSPQSFHIYFSDMGWRLASRAICPENVTVENTTVSELPAMENVIYTKSHGL